MRITRQMARQPMAVLAMVATLTALLAVPFLTMQPTESASQEPTGEVFDARDRIEERFASSVFTTFTVVEDRDGDLLRAEPLRELLANTERLRQDPEIGSTLFGYYDGDADTDVVGLLSVADLIDAELDGGLANATDAEIKTVAATLIEERGTTDLGLSAQTTTVDGLPVSPAILVPILSDDTILGFGGAGVRLGGDTDSEEYSRDVIELVRGDEENIQAWGVAIDVNLTSAEEGEAAGPFIGFTIAAVLLIVGLTFRSYWVLAVTGGALATLIVWLEGLTNLLGLKEDLLLSLIVPIAMVSFGVDFAFHAIGRYRESTAEGLGPRAAFGTGMAAVGGALILALASDSAAFLSNSSAGIESIVQFGIGAAIALVAAFVLLGLVAPLGVMVIEDKVGRPAPTTQRRIAAVAGSAGAAILAMASVLFSVFIYPPAGLVTLAVYLLVALVVPYALAKRQDKPADGFAANGEAVNGETVDGGAVNGGAATGPVGRGARLVGSSVTALARRPVAVLAAVAVVTVAAATFAVRLPTEFDVKDFFSADSDFVVGLDKLDEHGGEQAGEPADILVETDLTNVEAVTALQRFVSEMDAMDSERFARTDAGAVNFEGGLLELIDEVWAQPAAVGAIAQTSGVQLTDEDGDGLPDTARQLAALIETTRAIGVPIGPDRVVVTPDEVRTGLWQDGSQTATRLSIGLPGSRQVENIVEARAQLAPLVEQLETELLAVDPDSSVVVTGGPIARQESLDATSRALQISLPIAVGICLLIAAAFMRSIRLALVVIVPILIVVAWLYAFMYLLGFAINLVTATIGAVSIGIGIDFAIHFTERYREELARSESPIEAVRRSAEGTGTALVASAASSIVGFAILAAAPMPLFASYGFLTAVMIAMALLASLAVLPSLLVLVGPRSKPSSGTPEPEKADDDDDGSATHSRRLFAGPGTPAIDPRPMTEVYRDPVSGGVAPASLDAAFR